MLSSSTRQQQATMKLYDVVVVGGGLSGVMVGHGLEKFASPSSSASPIDWKLLEATDRLGGRLRNENLDGHIDMGGAWIWPFSQPYIKSLVRKLNIPTFQQPDEPSSTRIDGGAVEIVSSLASGIPKETRLELNIPVTSCSLESNGAAGNEKVVRLNTSTNQSFFARRVVFAVPPRILHERVKFDPPLSKHKQQALSTSHTWMAGVTKVALVYPKRFWDLEYSNMGLPQHTGPAFQVYDSSTKDESVSALTFFALVKPSDQSAVKSDEVLAKKVAEQMANVWKYLRQPESANQAFYYSSYHVQRWPLEKYISEDDKPLTIHPHPHPVRALSEPEWGGLLEFAGSETDRQSPGVMEGAVGAGNRVLQSLESFLKSLSSDRSSNVCLEANNQVEAQM
mmetsp:Transcript_18496/g.39938  ORF Transcript_18496/g.39938 Transcript_18496/m.39938 type:complete len:395 (-) Transcript_18496:1431-2615(-)